MNLSKTSCSRHLFSLSTNRDPSLRQEQTPRLLTQLFINQTQTTYCPQILRFLAQDDITHVIFFVYCIEMKTNSPGWLEIQILVVSDGYIASFYIAINERLALLLEKWVQKRQQSRSTLLDRLHTLEGSKWLKFPKENLRSANINRGLMMVCTFYDNDCTRLNVAVLSLGVALAGQNCYFK